MPDCQKIDPLVTRYVDGELPSTDRDRVNEHLQDCPPCHARVVAEQAVRELIHERKRDLEHDCASPALRKTCAAMAMLKAHWHGNPEKAVPLRAAPGVFALPGSQAGGRSIWTARAVPFALVAMLVLVMSGGFVYRLTESSVRVMAAELTADHVKCFAMNRVLGTADAPSEVRRTVASYFGWTPELPQQPERAGLELVGARTCLYGKGRIAHIMYRHRGVPVSVFMLPGSGRPEEIVEVMGHQAAVWSSGSRTFVLVAREPRPEVEQMASFVQASLR
jgi:anti-sigma factor RsiW